MRFHLFLRNLVPPQQMVEHFLSYLYLGGKVNLQATREKMTK